MEENLSFEIKKDLIPREVNLESEFSLNEEPSDKKKNWSSNEKHRLFYAYLKDIRSTSLLTPEQEIELSIIMRKCEARAKEIRTASYLLKKNPIIVN